MIGKILLAGFVCAGMAVAQTTASGHSAVSAPGTAAAVPAKTYAFDVVSIRRNMSPQQGIPQVGPTPDGYRMTNNSLQGVLMTAYAPQTGGVAYYMQDQIKALPDWVMSERYDIDARIAEEDRVDWQNPAEQKVMLQSMLQTMLVERCKLAVHREVKQSAVYSMVVAKGGPKVKETDPTVEHPRGMKLPDGGVIVLSNGGRGFYGVSMASFASGLSEMMINSPPVQDKTGLTGKYDIVLTFRFVSKLFESERQSGPSASDPGASIASDPAAAINSLLQDQFGLKLVPVKGPVETLVIDHIERPTPN